MCRERHLMGRRLSSDAEFLVQMTRVRILVPPAPPDKAQPRGRGQAFHPAVMASNSGIDFKYHE